MIRPNGSRRATATAAGLGSIATRMRPPSSGGNGNRLNTASMTLRISALRKLSASHCAQFGQVAYDVECQACDDRERNVDGGPGGGHQDGISTRMPQRAEIDRHRPRVAEQHRRAQQQQHAGQQDRAKRIDVPDRIQTDTPKAPGGIVAQAVRDKAVRGFVKGDGDDHRDRPGRYEIDCFTAHDFDPQLRPWILKRSRKLIKRCAGAGSRPAGRSTQAAAPSWMTGHSRGDCCVAYFTPIYKRHHDLMITLLPAGLGWLGTRSAGLNSIFGRG